MKTAEIVEFLRKQEDKFGSLEIRHHVPGRGHWSAGFARLIERRGDGLRSSVIGLGTTEEEAVQNLWDTLTIPNSFLSVAQYGTDTNYGWTGTKFVVLPDVYEVGLNGVLAALRSHIPDLPSAYTTNR